MSRCCNCHKKLHRHDNHRLGLLVSPAGKTDLVEAHDGKCWNALLVKGWRPLTDDEKVALKEKMETG
jgi:hypothetical protein